MAMVRLGKLKIRFQNGGVDFRLGDGEVRHFGLGRKSAGTDEAQPYSEDSSLNAQDADPGYGGRFSGYDDGYGDDYDDRDAGYDDGYGDDYDDRDAGYDDGYGDDYDDRDAGYDDGYGDDYDDRDAGYDDGYGDDYNDRDAGYGDRDAGYDDDYDNRDAAYDDGYGGDYDDRDAGYDPGYGDDYGREDGGYGEDDYGEDQGYEQPDGGYPAEGFGAVLQYVDENDWVTFLLLVLLPPLGIYLLWRRQRFDLKVRYGLSAGSAIWFVVLVVLLATVIFGGRGDTTTQGELVITTISPSPSATVDAGATATPAPSGSAQPSASPGASASPNASISPSATPIGSVSPSASAGNIATVWVTTSGDYYHNRQDCSNISGTASEVTLALAQERGLYACPVCYDATVYYATPGGRWYHTDQNCPGMSGAEVYSLERAEAEGKDPCPVCVLRTQTSLYPGEERLVFVDHNTTDRSGITVYWNSDGQHYHLENCSTVSGASPGSLRDAIVQGKTACQYCLPMGDMLVWCTEGGANCHLDPNCRNMSNASQVTLSEALVLGKTVGPTCMSDDLPADESGEAEDNQIYVYAVQGGRYYHINESCSNMGDGTPVRGPLRAAIEYGLSACPVCSSAANTLVYFTAGGTYYHSYATCRNMEDAQAATLAEALAYGYQQCPDCWGASTTQAPGATQSPWSGSGGTSLADEVMVYARADGQHYHLNENCSGMTGASHISLRVAVAAGKTACPTCCTVALTQVYSAESDSYFHNTASCSSAVSGATARTLADALMLNQSPCPNCSSSSSSGSGSGNQTAQQVYNFEVGRSGIQVYASLSDAYFHTNSSCSGRTGLVQVPLEVALNYAKTPCPTCASGAATVVYASPNNSYYHLSESCAGDGAVAGPLAIALAMGMEGCPYCVTGSATGEGEPAAYPEPGNLVPGTSGVYVYATPDGDYYHLTESDAGSGAVRIALEIALNYGKSACPNCCSFGDATVYATPGQSYFHTNRAHAGDGSVGLTYALALSLGLDPCPDCFGSGAGNSGAAPTAGPEYSAPESTVVYVNLYGTDYMYHSASSCSGSGMSGGTAETLEFALDLGYGRCPYCNPPSSIG